jgi:hypothetical protein
LRFLLRGKRHRKTHFQAIFTGKNLLATAKTFFCSVKRVSKSLGKLSNAGKIVKKVFSASADGDRLKFERPAAGFIAISAITKPLASLQRP